jgi:2-iminoacetate synthase
MFIDDDRVFGLLETGRARSGAQVREVLAKAREARGLSSEDVAALLDLSDPELLGELFATARAVKERIYGKRLVLFAPLYVSNLCANECSYCAFRAKNAKVKRRALTQTEIADEVRVLIEQGHKRVLLVAGESYPDEGLDYVLKAIDTVYATRVPPGEIRRLNVNIAPLGVNEFRELKARQIGTYQLFQETYHRPTYEQFHLKGPKKNYDWRVTAMDRAMTAGIEDVGIGVLFGLFDWRYEVLALLEHAQHLERTFGVGPHTLSVPRLEPATGSELASHPPHPIADVEFRKIVAILRLAVPYTGIIMSTRETAHVRRETFAVGVSQISAGSRTNPGGYASHEKLDEAQFSLGDHRTLDEVIRDIASLGYVPSFCTACYRLGRTGRDFMDLAKPGAIRAHCDPNAMGTFLEYLMDYASPATREVGERLLAELSDATQGVPGRRARHILEAVQAGKRDVFV